MNTSGDTVGAVASIWRYPVKSMLGEEVAGTTVAARGLEGDRAFALLDVETGRVVSAKNPRRWPGLFACRATLDATGTARMALADGTTLTSADGDADARLSAALGRPVRLVRDPIAGAVAEGYSPEDNSWFEFALPPGSFFDGATVHLVTTATLAHLAELAPGSQFETARFRPNFVLTTAGDGFVEQRWLGRTLTLGEVLLRIDGPCPRCVMTTLPQGTLPHDPAILRTAVRHASGNVGVYASVVRGGVIPRGAAVVLGE